MLKHRYFSVNCFFYDRCGIQRRLEALAQKGWLLEDADYFGWHFVRTQPRKIHYAVTYFVKQSQYTSEADENISAFNELCEERGWNYVTSHSNLRVYCNENPDPIPMDTDPTVELSTIHRAAKRSFLPAHWVYMCLSLLMLVLVGWSVMLDPVEMLSSNLNLFSYPLFVPAAAISAIELVSYYRWRARARKYAEVTGEFLPARSRPLLLRVLVIFILLSFIANLLLGGLNRENVDMLFRFAMLTIAGIVAYLVREHHKAKGSSAAENRGATVAIVLIAAIVMTMVGNVIKDPNSFGEMFTTPIPENYGSGFNFDDPIPLTLSDLGIAEIDDGIDHSYFETDSSIALGHTYYQTNNGPGQQWMFYYVDDVRISMFYDTVLDHLLHRTNGPYPPTGFEKIDPDPWGADEAWFSPCDIRDTGIYILCIENRIISLYLSPDIELSDAQKAIIGEKLSPHHLLP